MPPNMLDDVNANDKSKIEPFWKLMRSKAMFLRCVVIFINWLAVGMGFYGMSINIVNLAGNVYFNYLIFNIFEFVAYILCTLLIDRLGRKPVHCGAMLISGVACTLTILPRLLLHGEHYWIIIVLATIGNMGVCSAFASIYLFSLELFPTVARTSGMGVSSTFARIGSIASPYVADLGWIIGGDFGDNMPLLVFGVTLIFAGLLSLVLPETLMKPLPETLEDAENLGRSPPRGTEEEMTALQTNKTA